MGGWFEVETPSLKVSDATRNRIFKMFKRKQLDIILWLRQINVRRVGL